MKIAIQPCSDSAAQEHYADTIASPVQSSRILPFLAPEDRAQFQTTCGPMVAVWGVTPGKQNVNRNKWRKLAPGDIALLYKDKKLFSQGRICLTLHNRPLAQDLWKTDGEGNTWEYIYFLNELQEIEIPVAEYNRAMKYKPSAIVQGFNVFDGAKADAILDLLEVDPSLELGEFDRQWDFDSTVARLAAIQAMNVDAMAQSRAEAGPLRGYLFGGKKTDRCDLCGKELPVGFLVAAHIKKRASCTDDEKRDPHL